MRSCLRRQAQDEAKQDRLLAATRLGIEVLAGLVDLAPQVAPFIGREAPVAAGRLGMLGVLLLLQLEHAALFFGARLERTRIELARRRQVLGPFSARYRRLRLVAGRFALAGAGNGAGDGTAKQAAGRGLARERKPPA